MKFLDQVVSKKRYDYGIIDIGTLEEDQGLNCANAVRYALLLKPRDGIGTPESQEPRNFSATLQRLNLGLIMIIKRGLTSPVSINAFHLKPNFMLSVDFCLKTLVSIFRNWLVAVSWQLATEFRLTWQQTSQN